MKILILIVSFSALCVSYYPTNFASITSYVVSSSLRTPKGIKVDLGQHEVDFEKIDKQVNDLEHCLGRPIKRNAFLVKFPDDVYLSPCTGEELFPCAMPNDVCIRKINGDQVKLLENSPCTLEEIPCRECPCHCRATIQGNYAIITTPKVNNPSLTLS